MFISTVDNVRMNSNQNKVDHIHANEPEHSLCYEIDVIVDLKQTITPKIMSRISMKVTTAYYLSR